MRGGNRAGNTPAGHSSAIAGAPVPPRPKLVRSLPAGLAPAADDRLRRLAGEVAAGLSKPQKQINCTYLYDALGSALFEAITLLPEYGLTRADERLLAAHAGDIVARMPAPFDVVELGSGSGRKTRLLLERVSAAWVRKPEGAAKTRYFPIDISAAALAHCASELSSLAGVEVFPIEGDHLRGLREAVSRREAGRRFLVLFLGSCIGNFARAAAVAFLTQVRARLRRGDALLMAADLEKNVARMLLAYDDSIGLTAAFNRNVLARLNRELGADFAPQNFDHEARWNPLARRIEMHLVSRCAQRVSLPVAEASFTIARGETIRTEECHKYRPDDLDALAQTSGFRVDARWLDSAWPFAEDLWLAE